jgi:hypothetical protein
MTLQPRRVYVLYVEAGNLSLEIQDPAGQRVPPLSPPVPRVDDGVTGWITLAPGASQAFEAAAAVGVDTPPGTYRVRFSGVPGDATAGGLRSDWIPFEVAP